MALSVVLVQGVEGLLQVREQVINGLNAHGDAHEVCRRDEFGAFRGDMGHVLWVLDEGLHTAEGLRQ